jgi:hypothetical protein
VSELHTNAQACAKLRLQLCAADQSVKEKRASTQAQLLSLPDEHYSKHLKAVKEEMLALGQKMLQFKEQQEEKALVEARLSAALEVTCSSA